MGDNLPAVNLGTGRTENAIDAGSSYTCAVLDNATVKCWGLNNSGQLGQGTTANLGDGANEMGDNLAAVSLGTGRTATGVVAAGSHTCATLDNGTMKCWGLNTNGQLGQGSTTTLGDGPNEMGDNLAAISLGTGRSAARIAASGSHGCVILDNATVKCWGLNTNGQLGQGSTTALGDGPNEMGDNLRRIDFGVDPSA